MAKMWYEEWPSEDFFDSQEEIDPAEDISENETLGNAISQERRAAFEQSLVQDEHPRDYDAELEDEVEEAAPTSDKRLKREIKAEALRRLEEAARTEADFQAVINQWDKLDQNRERRERDHENLRGDADDGTEARCRGGKGRPGIRYPLWPFGFSDRPAHYAVFYGV